MYMTKNKIMFWVFAIFASAVIALGFCFLFLGTKNVDVAPNQVKIESVDGELYLSTDYNAEFGYQFKLEHEVDGEFVLVDMIESKSNLIKLSDCNIDVQAGQMYRFSARYTAENGATGTKFSGENLWKASWQLEQVKNVAYNPQTKMLTWTQTGVADYYVVKLIDETGKIVEYSNIVGNSFDINSVDVGSYKVFVSAGSNNEWLTSSTPSGCLDIVISKKNEIKLASFDDKNLTVSCTQKVDAFSIMIGTEQIAVVSPDKVEQIDGRFIYTLNDAKIYMRDNAQIKSLATKYVSESELIEIA